MQFGITLKPEHLDRAHDRADPQAEAAGFRIRWSFDSHVLCETPIRC
jgi:hypothetical protein